MNATGPIPRFRSLDRLSLPGSRVNEDGIGLRGPFAWVIDGATGLSEEQLTSGGSDAAWLSGLIDNRLTALAGGERADAVLSRLEADIQGILARSATTMPPQPVSA